MHPSATMPHGRPNPTGERYQVIIDKASGFDNDANLWTTETMGDAKYPLALFLLVITVSLETMKIVNGLPELGSPAK